MNNQTKASIGALAGAVSVIAWWVVSITTDIEAPEAVVAASVALFTAILQLCIPYRTKRNTRKTDANADT